MNEKEKQIIELFSKLEGDGSPEFMELFEQELKTKGWLL